jgi:hypothetical protein
MTQKTNLSLVQMTDQSLLQRVDEFAGFFDHLVGPSQTSSFVNQEHLRRAIDSHKLGEEEARESSSLFKIVLDGRDNSGDDGVLLGRGSSSNCLPYFLADEFRAGGRQVRKRWASVNVFAHEQSSCLTALGGEQIGQLRQLLLSDWFIQLVLQQTVDCPYFFQTRWTQESADERVAFRKRVQHSFVHASNRVHLVGVHRMCLALSVRSTVSLTQQRIRGSDHEVYDGRGGCHVQTGTTSLVRRDNPARARGAVEVVANLETLSAGVSPLMISTGILSFLKTDSIMAIVCV